MTYEASFIANREVRLIPPGWQHPKDERGKYIPLLDRRYWVELAEELGADSPLIGKPMPEVRPGDAVEIAAYETTTEGTPISPAYPNTPEGRLAIANWCAEHASTFGSFRADAEAWAAMLFTDHVVLVDPDDGSIRIP